MTPQVCSFFDDAGFVLDDWHELTLQYVPAPGETVILCAANQAYATCHVVVRITHTLHRDWDGNFTQVLDIFVTAQGFYPIPALRGGVNPSIDIVDATGEPIHGWADIRLPHCPRVGDGITYAADGTRATSEYKVEEVQHVLRKTERAGIIQRVAATVVGSL